MPTGITVNGTDLDDIFKARVSPKRADVEFEVAGVDISNRYEPAGTDNSKITYNTGFRVAGEDLRYFFMKKGYNPFNVTLSFSVVQYSADCWQIYISSSISLTCKLNFRFLNQGAKVITFNPANAADGYRRFNVVNQGDGRGALHLDTVTFYKTDGTIFGTYGIGKSFSVPTNNFRGDGSTVAAFTIANNTQSNLGTYTLASNTISKGTANATFSVNFTAARELNEPITGSGTSSVPAPPPPIFGP